MCKVSVLIMIITLSCPSFLDAFSLRTMVDGDDIVINSEYRDLCQGEVLKVSLQTPPPLLQARARFMGKEFVFVPSQDGSYSFCLIGIGTNVTPGIYDLVIRAGRTEEQYEDFVLKIPITEKKFSIEKITVKKSYLYPSLESRERMKKDRALLRIIYKRYTNKWLGSGRFTVPLKGKITGAFGVKRIFNNDVPSYHRGIDIQSPQGRRIGAANAGKVVLARNLFLSGETVIIDHGIGVFSQYLHLSRIYAKEGELINKGETVGLVGSTGRSSGPHLHWGIRIKNQYVDPFSLLSLTFD